VKDTAAGAAEAAPATTTAAPSLRRQLLWGVLTPMLLFSLFEALGLYQSVSRTVGEAYDRFLVAAAYSVADSVSMEAADVRGSLPLALREAFESASGGSRVYFLIRTLSGERIVGDPELREADIGDILGLPSHPTHPELRDAAIQGRAVRMAVLFQTLELPEGERTAVIQVAHTLEARDAARSEALRGALLRHGLFLAMVAAVVAWVILHRLRPVQRLRSQIDARPATDLSPLRSAELRELQPMVDSINQLMQRLNQLHAQQERFVADASHQLQTPLTVLKTQLQAALAEADPQDQRATMQDMLRTTDRASGLVRQMLSMVRVHQVQVQGRRQPIEWSQVVRDASVELSPLIGQKQLRFDLQLQACDVAGDHWMLGEMVRNLLHNAIRFTPPRGELGISLECVGDQARLVVWDSGPGIAPDMLGKLGEPFFTVPGVPAGAGLGLAICIDVARSLGGDLRLENRTSATGQVLGAQVVVRLPRVVPDGWV
jgi:two-component system sensor histidine kinase TctE